MKKTLLVILVLVISITFSACKNAEKILTNNESDFSTSSEKTMTELDSSVNQGATSSLEENKDKDVTTSSKEEINNKKENTNGNSSNDTSNDKEEIYILKKMLGTWSLVIPENTVFDGWHYSNFLFEYEIQIFEDLDDEKYYVKVDEKEYIRSDTTTFGEVKYFDNQRYTLANSSIDLWNDFDGTLFSGQDDSVVVFEIEGYELERGRMYIEETHYFTLIDDTHIQWNSCEIYTKNIGELGQYFPWNTSTIFSKQ